MPLTQWISGISLLVGTTQTFAACSAQVSDTYEIREGSAWSFTEFIDTIETFPYSMPVERRRKLLEYRPSTVRRNGAMLNEQTF